VRAGRAAGNDRRLRRLDGNRLERRLEFFDDLGHAGDRAAGADARDDKIHLAVGVAPDFLGGRAAVDLRIGRVGELLQDLKNGIWSELPSRKAVDYCRRSLQKAYVEKLLSMIEPASQTNAVPTAMMRSGNVSISSNSDIYSIVKSHLKTLMTELKIASAATSDPITKAHWADLADRIDMTLDKK